jgi:hypothetical protein
VSNRKSELSVLAGFKKEKPSDARFSVEFDAEVERLRDFLGSER